jgi:erythromycin esterase-like protein
MEMVLYLRADLQARDLTEDDLNGARLRLAHGHLAAAVIYDEVQPEKAELLRARVLGVLDEETGTRAGGMLNESLRSVWLDADRDGVVDDGEMDTIEGARLVDSKSFYTSSSYDADERRFSRGERH